MPLREGDIAEGSQEEFVAQVNILFYLILFNSPIRALPAGAAASSGLPCAWRARLGHNAYNVGAILDPPLTYIGNNCIIGHHAVLFPHAIENTQLHFPQFISKIMGLSAQPLS